MKPNLLMAIILPLSFVDPQDNLSTPGFTIQVKAKKISTGVENPYPIIGAIPVPEGYTRIAVKKNSFGEWLRNTELKKNKTVYLFNGSPKKDQSSQYAVLNITVGNKDLQQCADAIIRLRAEYFYSQKKFDKINFRDNNNTNYQFAPRGVLHLGVGHLSDYFNKYLENVFAHCGTLSLEKQLFAVHDINELQIGDVLIQGGSPGHAMLIVDMAIDYKGRKIFLLAQGYMPAQDIHIVINPMSPEFSPWYEMNNDTIITPGWVFSPKHFKTW